MGDGAPLQRLSGQVTQHDTDLSLLVREGEAVTSKLRTMLTSSLLDGGTSYRRKTSVSPHRPGGRPRPDLSSSPLTRHRQMHSNATAVHRTRSLGDVRPRRATSTPYRTHLQPSHHLSNILDSSAATHSNMEDSELYNLEDETRQLQREVSRLESLVTSSRVERNNISQQYVTLSEQVGSEWQEYHKRLQHFQELHSKQAALISKLSNKIRQYRSRVRDVEARATESVHRRSEAEQRGEMVSAALSTAQDKLHAAQAQHQFDLQLAMDGLQHEKDRSTQLLAELEQTEASAVTRLSSAGGLQRERDEAREQLSRLQQQQAAREQQWNREAKQYSRSSISSHKKVLTVSREAGNLRRGVSELAALTRRDLCTLSDDLTRYTGLIAAACASAQDAPIMASSTDLWARIQDCEKLQARTEAEKQNLKEKINDLNFCVTDLNTTLKDRERCILDLNRKLEEGVTEAEVQEGLREKVRTLETYLVDIAQCVLRDAEQLRPETVATHPPSHQLLRLSRDGGEGAGLSSDLPQSTVSAVRSALADRQLQIHELQLKLNSHKDQLSSLRKQYEAADAAAVSLEGSVGELRDQLETLARERDQTNREKERVVEDLEALQAEKDVLEKAKAALKTEMEHANEETERKSRHLSEMEAERAAWHEERQHIYSKFSKERDDVAKHAHTITVLHTELASVKQQVSLLSDSVGKLRASEERLEEGRDDLLEQVRDLERHRTDLETQLAIAQRQETEMRHTLDKVEEYNLSLSQEKSAAQGKVALLETERATNATERAELRSELERVQDMLAAIDEERAAAEANLARMSEKVNLLTIEKEKAELELNDALSERNELHSHVSGLERARNALEDELGSASVAITERDKQVASLAQEKEHLAKLLAEIEIKMAGREKDLSLLRESFASVKSEKHGLENLAAALEKKWSANEGKRTLLEKENQTLKLDKERIQTQLNKLQRELEGELSRVREAKSGLERTLDELTTQHKKLLGGIHEEYEGKLEALKKEKGGMESDLQERLNGALHVLQTERDEGGARKEAEIAAIRRNLDKLQREKDDSAHRYQEEKHQALMIAQQEISSLEEKVTGLQRDLSSYENQLDQLKRAGSTKAEAGRVSEATLHQNVAKLKEDLHTTSIAHDKQLRGEKDALERRIKEIHGRLEEQRRDHEQQLAIIKSDLRLAKEDAMRFQQDLEDAEQKIAEAEANKLLLQKEVTRLAEEGRQVEERRSADLQAAIKGLDYEKKDLQKKLQDKETKVTGLEVAEAKNADLIARMTAQLRELGALRQDAQRHCADANRKLQVLETEGLAKSQEVESLRLRINTEEDRHTTARQEAAKLKSKVGEYERERDGLTAELALLERRLAELEDHHNARESHLQSNLEECRNSEHKLLEDKKQADNMINQMQQQLGELKVTASREGGKAEALDHQLASLEAAKDMLERRLHSIYAALRTLTHSYGGTARKGEESMSGELAAALSESMSGLEKDKGGSIEVDPEAVKLELRTLMNQINTVECERDEAVSRSVALEREVAEVREAQQRAEDRLREVTRTLAELEEKKRHVDDKLNRSTAALGHNEEALHRKESEIRALTEELSGLRRKMADMDHDRMQLQDRHQKVKASQTRLDAEAGDLRERSRGLEQRCSLLEDAKQRVEADLNAARRQATERHAELESAKSNSQASHRSLRVLEDQNAALKSKVEELRARIASAASCEADLKDKLSGMNRSLKETVAASTGLEEELTRSQSVLSRTDSDRRQLEERLAALQVALTELRRQKEQAVETKQKTQQDVANAETRISELELNLKALRGNLGDRNTTAEELIAKMSRVEHEKSQLRSQLVEVERKLAVSEAEKRDFEKMEYRSDKDRSNIRKILGKYSQIGAGVDGVDASMREASLGSLRLENLELRRKLDETETEKAQLQQKHLTELRDASNEQRRERQNECEKVRRLGAQMESLRQEKERCQLRIHALEQQIQQYRDQIREYRSRSNVVAGDVRRVRLAMTDSLHNIATHPRVSTSALDNEIQNLSAIGGISSSNLGDVRGSRRYGSVSPRRRRTESGGSKKNLAFS